MKLVRFGKKIEEPVTLALGYFDCVHNGHRQLLSSAKKLAHAVNSKFAVFTFINNPDIIFDAEAKSVNTFTERAAMLEALGADYVIFTQFDAEFAENSAQWFLDKLSRCCTLKGVVCGFDFRFGNKAEGGTGTLEKFCAENFIVFQIQPEVLYRQQKISTTLIKQYLQNGEITDANRCLGYNYFLEGYVNAGCGVGRTLGFPTANLEVEPEKFLPKSGVYAGKAFTENTEKKCVVNIGGRPTFDSDVQSVEAHLLDFSEDIYFKKICVELTRYLRPVYKFPSGEELAAQICKDIEEVKND